MNDHPLYKKQIKIPTIVGIFIVIAIIAGLATGINYLMKENARANVELSPQNIEITSITDSGFTVIWETTKPSFSALRITLPDGKQQTFFDERYHTSEQKKYITTSIPVRGLQPNTEYAIELLINGKSFVYPAVSSVRTGPTLSIDTNGMLPIYGSIMTKDNTPAEGAIVFVSLGTNSQTLSGIVKPSGSWMIPLNLLRSNDLTRLIEPTEETGDIFITIRYQGEETKVITDNANARPVPTIILGNSYDFRGQGKRKMQQEVADNNSFSSVLGTVTPDEKHISVQLLHPVNNGIVISDPPLFAGRGIPGNVVTLLLGEKEPYVYTTRVRSDGEWRLTPSKPIGAGKQKVTMTTIDKDHTPVTITHAFTIMKSGIQVLGDATPSATITEMPTPTEEPTPTPTPNIPTTGITTPTHILFIFAIGLILAGFIGLAW